MDEANKNRTDEAATHEVLDDVRQLSEGERHSYVEIALARARGIAAPLSDGETLYKVFEPMLRFVVTPPSSRPPFAGGCHNTSAVLYMLLREAGLSEDNLALCVGEVIGDEAWRRYWLGRSGRMPRFDHSWVEVSGKVLDVAVCVPGPTGGFAGGPVFGGVDLGSDAVPKIKFGIASNDALDDDARMVNGMNLRQYQDHQDRMRHTSMAELVQSVYGLDGKSLIAKYGDVRRDWRNPALNP
ncbi:hypothetical protein [Paraburkholderia sp. C35]|uniref:hypothetical protein n=1 Tax=Paraburkholderia sp. C35 TaxID=2126993 RepID=UPI000D6977E0|nr:hypothetical protein [Paraburkholderia sp. C35]